MPHKEKDIKAAFELLCTFWNLVRLSVQPLLDHTCAPLQVRLSTGKDLRLSVSMADTIGQLKKQLQAQEDIDAAHQRWFFSGKLLTDKTRLQDTKIQKDFVIQVIVNPQALQAPKPSTATAVASPVPE